MARQCPICKSDKTAMIRQLRMQNLSYRKISAQSGFTFAQIRNHISEHVDLLDVSNSPAENFGALSELMEQRARLKSAITAVDASPNLRAKLEGVLLRVTEAIQRVQIECVADRGTKPGLERETREFVSRIAESLRAHPEARRAVLTMLDKAPTERAAHA